MNETRNRSRVMFNRDDYEKAKDKVNELVMSEPLHVQVLEKEMLEANAAQEGRHLSSVAQKCVNYLRHNASAYDMILQKLNQPDGWCSTDIERHVLHVERRRCVAVIKSRILDEIARAYPWLQEECRRQKLREGVEDEPSEFVLPFGPFKGQRLHEVQSDYLFRLLGLGSIQRSVRIRIERHLAERQARAEICVI